MVPNTSPHPGSPLACATCTLAPIRAHCHLHASDAQPSQSSLLSDWSGPLSRMTVPPDPQVKTETTDDIDIDMNGVAPTAPAPAHSSESNTSATTMAPEPSDTQQQHQQHQQHHAAPPVPHDPTVAVGTAPPPARKERNLREFLDMMEEHAPIVRRSYPN